jgi:hypothetical protein
MSYVNNNEKNRVSKSSSYQGSYEIVKDIICDFNELESTDRKKYMNIEENNHSKISNYDEKELIVKEKILVSSKATLNSKKKYDRTIFLKNKSIKSNKHRRVLSASYLNWKFDVLSIPKYRKHINRTV